MSELRVRFAETDQMGVAHHGAYVAWLEVGRVEWLREHGYSYSELEASGVSLAVADLQLRYRQSALFDDVLTIETRLVAAGSRGCSFAYRVIRSVDGGLLAEARTSHVAVDRSGRTVRLPDGWLRFLRASLPPGDAPGRC